MSSIQKTHTIPGALQFLYGALAVSLAQNVAWWVLWSQKDKNDTKKNTFLIWAILLSINFVCIFIAILYHKSTSNYYGVFHYVTVLAFLILLVIGSLSSFTS